MLDALLRRGPAAAQRLHHEGRADAQHLPRRRRAAGALHPQRLGARHGARRGRRPAAKAASWCIFPEGTRTVGAADQPVQARHHADRPAGAGADPDRLHRDRLALPRARAGRCWRVPPLPIVFTLRLGQRFAPAAPTSDALLRELEQYFRQHGTARRRRAARMPDVSRTHLVVIPSYNTGADGLRDGARGARALEAGVGGGRRQRPTAPPRACSALAAADPRPARRWCCRATAARARRCCTACEAARAAGFTHALTMDSDGQHPADLIPAFMRGIARRGPTRWCSAGRCSTPSRRCCACAAGASRTGGPTSRRWAPASTIRSTAFASIRSRRWSR